MVISYPARAVHKDHREKAECGADTVFRTKKYSQAYLRYAGNIVQTECYIHGASGLLSLRRLQQIA